MYNTSGDVLETTSVPGLERAARFFEFFLRQVAKEPSSDVAHDNVNTPSPHGARAAD